ncbi:MAG: beta-ketoacyl-ACP synthase I [Brevundimonas sp.]|nr:MAG: beta-ketoacyl-ACP synthase I [Brevundimonas sp.]
MRRVVVTGLGIVSSIGTGKDEVLSSLREARSGVQPATDFAAHGFRSQVWAPPSLGVTAEDWAPLVDRRAARFLSNGTAWAHIAFEEALKDSGMTPDEIKDDKIGVIVGEGGPSTQVIIQAAATTVEKGSPKRIGPFAVPKAMSSGPSAVLSTWFEMRGVNYSISSACATSAHCIGAGVEQIQWGKQDVVFAGGCEDIDWSMSNMFDAMGAMSSNFNETAPTRASRAYDVSRDGFVIAGGAGMVVLEEYERAKARGAHIYGEVVGYAANADGYDMVAPSGEGAERCMKLAMSQAGDRRIDYLNPHGTSTPVGDAKEMGAVRNVFGADMPLISSTKSLTGHSLGAAGVWEAIYSLLMLEHGFAAESAHIENLDPEFEGMPILRARKDVELTTVMSNSFGFGGTNGTLILSKV